MKYNCVCQLIVSTLFHLILGALFFKIQKQGLQTYSPCYHVNSAWLNTLVSGTKLWHRTTESVEL